jgi:hypothetical protein
MAASAFGLGYFLDPLSKSLDSLALGVYIFFWAPFITNLVAREEGESILRRPREVRDPGYGAQQR